MTADGVAHTVALPDPARVLSDDAKASWAVLVMHVPSDDILDVLEEAQEHLFGETSPPLPPDGDDRFVGETPRAGIVDTDLSTLDGLRSALATLEERWRLDVALALEDLVLSSTNDD